MSIQRDPFSNPLNIQIVEAIDQLDLTIMQKHHVRLLAHCLNTLKLIFTEDSIKSLEENLLKKWCDNQSKKFNDEQFSDLFYEQLSATAKKLDTFSHKIGKDIWDLDIDDLVMFVKKS